MAKDLAGLPSHIDSRAEQFLAHIARRSTDLNALPVPESRIEEYLEYLAYNSGSSSDAFNKLSQNVNGIEFKNGDTTKATLSIITEEEIDNIINNLR